jgi:hypothetical protein
MQKNPYKLSMIKNATKSLPKKTKKVPPKPRKITNPATNKICN